MTIDFSASTPAVSSTAPAPEMSQQIKVKIKILLQQTIRLFQLIKEKG